MSVERSILICMGLLLAGAVQLSAGEGPPVGLASVEVSAETSSRDHLFYPGEPVVFNVRLRNRSEERLDGVKAAYSVEQLFGKPAEGFGKYTIPPKMCEAADLHIPPITLEPKGEATVSVAPAVTRMGCFLLSVRLSLGDQTIAVPVASYARIFRPHPGFKYDSYLISGYPGWSITKEANTAMGTIGRLGFKWIRASMYWPAMQPEKDKWNWDYCDDFFRMCLENGIYVLGLALHTPGWALINGQPARPREGKIDATPPPASLGYWKEFFRQTTVRYKDVLRAWEVWNEPWEGNGITEYASTGKHYREMHIAACEGVKAGDPGCLVGSNGSEANCADNMLCVPGMEKYFDFGLIHMYGGCSSYGPEFFRKLGKDCWDTESWNLLYVDEPRLLQFIHIMRGRGQKKAQPIVMGGAIGLFETDAIGRGPNPIAASLAAVNWFLEDTQFVERVNPRSAPWVCLSRGKEKSVAFVCGRMGERGRSWDQQTRDGLLRLADPQKRFEAFDRFGEPLGRANGAFEIPLTMETFYVTAASSDFRALREALAEAEISGIVPVQIEVHDFTAPLAGKPPLRVTIHNAYNATLEGEVTVQTPPALAVQKPTLPIGKLRAGESIALEFPLASAETLPQNRYDVKILVHTARGDAELAEAVSVACFAHGTPLVDGDLSDWDALGAQPLYLAPRKFEFTTAEKGWFPMKEWKDRDDAGFFGRLAGAWDDKTFYVMAEVNEPAFYPHPGPLTGKWYELAPPPYDYTYSMIPRYVFEASQVQIAFDCRSNADTLLPPDDPGYRDTSFRNTDYEYGLMPTKADGNLVWRYLAPGLRWHHWYPFSPRMKFDQGPVKGATVIVKRDEERKVTVYEAAIPLAELKDLKPKPGKVARFSFRFKNADGSYLEWATERSIARWNIAFHPEWSGGWSVETEFGFAGKKDGSN